MKIIWTAVVTSVLWIGLIIGIHYLSSQPQKRLTLNAADFKKNEFSDWVAIPADAKEINVHFFGGFDTNYRTIGFDSSSLYGDDLIDKSISKNPQHKDEKIVILKGRQFSLDGLFSVFKYGNEAIPSWWISRYVGTNDATVIFWSHNEYGMGYLIIQSPLLGHINILQFSQQWLDIDRLEKAFPMKMGSEPRRAVNRMGSATVFQASVKSGFFRS